jgi:hypothetical protein
MWYCQSCDTCTACGQEHFDVCGHEPGCPYGDDVVHESDFDACLPVSTPGNNDGYVEPDDPMDGDHESALASAGFGTDEDYGLFDSGDDE